MLSAIIDLKRRGNYYSDAYLTVDAAGASAVSYRIRKKGDDEWSAPQIIDSGEEVAFEADNACAWDVRVTIEDDAGGTATYNCVLPAGLPMVFYDDARQSVGFQCFPGGNRTVEAYGVNIRRDTMTRLLSYSVGGLEVGDYRDIPLDVANMAGYGLTASELGGIIVGSGISKVRLSATLAFNVAGASGIRTVQIVRGDDVLASGRQEMTIGGQVVITPVMADVKEGDELILRGCTAHEDDVIGVGTWMTVEAVM